MSSIESGSVSKQGITGGEVFRKESAEPATKAHDLAANPELWEFRPKSNVSRNNLTNRRSNVEVSEAPEVLLLALKAKITDLEKTGKGKKNPEILNLKKKAENLEKEIPTTMTNKQRKDFNIQAKEDLENLDSPEITKLGKVSSLLAGFALGVTIAALAVGLVSNPVGWALIALAAVVLLAVLIYQFAQGTGIDALKYASVGAVVGGLSIGLAGAGLLGAAAASSFKAGGTAVSLAMDNAVIGIAVLSVLTIACEIFIGPAVMLGYNQSRGLRS